MPLAGEQRPTRTVGLLGTAVFAIVVSAAIYGSFEQIGLDPAFPRRGELGDFGSFYEAGRAATRREDPYGVYPLTYFAAAGPAAAARNLNAPFSVLLFEPLTLLEPVTAARLWNVAALLAYLAAVLLLHAAYAETRAPWRLVWALGISSLWGTLALGQIYTFLALGVTGAWLLLQRGRDREAGFLIGAIVAIKPNFVVWPLLLLFARHRRAALFALSASAAFGLLPVLQLGPLVYVQWLTVVRANAPSAEVTNGALSGLFARMGLPAWFDLVVAAALLIGAALWAWRVRPSPVVGSAAALTATLLASPVTWTGYALLVVPIFFAHRWNLLLGIAAAILLVPIGSVLLPLSSVSPVSQVIVGSSYTWDWLLLLIATLRSGARSSRSPTPT